MTAGTVAVYRPSMSSSSDPLAVVMNAPLAANVISPVPGVTEKELPPFDHACPDSVVPHPDATVRLNVSATAMVPTRSGVPLASVPYHWP
jgi:hypothetical protein